MDKNEVQVSDLRVIQLTADNFMALEAVDITPDPTWNEVTGANAEGKTSVLRAIFAALGGSRERPATPIRRGANKTRVTITLGGEDVRLDVELKITQGSESLEVKVNGEVKAKPQQVLDALLGKIGFDPIKFMHKDKKEKKEALLQTLGLGEYLADWEKADAELRQNRLVKGRELKTAKGAYEAMTPPPASTPKAEVSIADLTAEYEQAQGIHEKKRTVESRIAEARAALQRNSDLVKEYEEKVKALKKQNADYAEQIDAAITEFNSLELPDLEAIKAKLQNVQETNRAVRQREDYEAKKKAWRETEKQHDTLDEQVKAHAEAKERKLAEANMPVDGLGFDEDGITFDGLPLEQRSFSEQLMICTAIAMAVNPTVRVITIQDGSAMDDESLGALYRMAHERGYQMFVERVDTTGKVGIVIKDGAVIAQNEPREFEGQETEETTDNG